MCVHQWIKTLITGSAQEKQHNIYIWNRESGQLIKTLEGPKEGIMDLTVYTQTHTF